MSNRRVLVTIANGSEEIESVSIIDTLRRAQIEVTVAKVFGDKNVEEQFENRLQIRASRGVYLVADTDIESVKDQQFDMIVLPGGLNGAKTFAKSETLINMLQNQNSRHAWTAAICASPAVVFASHGILDNVEAATCYPGLRNEFESNQKQQRKCNFLDERVVRCGNVVTSQGPGTAIEFALNLISVLVDNNKAAEVAKAMLIPFHPVADKKQ